MLRIPWGDHDPGDHAGLLHNLSRKRVGRPGLESGTNAESFRGCPYVFKYLLNSSPKRRVV